MATKDKNGLAFIKEVAKYFMDFLETDFHKRKNPKRSIQFRSSNNLLIGLNLNKYPSFDNLVNKAINHAFDKNTLNTISKGVYRTNIPKNLLDLVKLQTEKITSKQITKILEQIAEEIEKSVTLYKKEYDQALNNSLEAVAKILKTDLVLPFVSNIEKPLENLNLGDEDNIYLMEEELTAVLSSSLENKISEVVKLLLAKEKVDISKKLKDVFDLADIKLNIHSFFESFQVGDLFTEIYEMERNRTILDKQEFYLYFCDITFNNAKFPIFYIPFGIEKQNEVLTIEFDSQVYINKKALEYITQEYNQEKGKKGNLKTISERIIYLAQHKNDFRDVVSEILSEITNFFELDKRIDINNSEQQIAKSLLVRASNNCYLALFDKSDEALVNDYEEILKLLVAGDSVLGEAFNKLIDDFIHKDPKKYNIEIQEEWNDQDVPSQLVFQSPIPLNGEQLQILSAIKRDDCKYIIVQGPPGTGKSHTITAVVFNLILKNKSILVLSDKKEALDVVEDKITETMNRVRVDDNFQNPVLRLGKTGNAYAKILSPISIKSTIANWLAVKKDYKSVEENIEKSENSLKEDIEAEILANSEVDLKEIHEYFDLESYYVNKGFPVEIDEVLNQAESAIELEEFKKIFLSLKDKLIIDHDEKEKEAKLFELLNFSINDFKDISNFQKYLRLLNFLSASVAKMKEVYANELFLLPVFEIFDKNSLEKLNSFITMYESEKNLFDKLIDIANEIKKYFPKIKSIFSNYKELDRRSYNEIKKYIFDMKEEKHWMFGYLFSDKKTISNLNKNFKIKLTYISSLDPHKNIKIFESTLSTIEGIKIYEKDLQGINKDIDIVSFIHKAIVDDNFIELGILNPFQKEKVISLDEEFKKSLHLSSQIEPHNNLEDFKKISIIYQFAKDQGKQLDEKYKVNFDYLRFVHKVIADESLLKVLDDLIQIGDDLKFLNTNLPKYPNTIKKLKIDLSSFKTFCSNDLVKISNLDFDRLIRFINLKQKVEKDFKNIPSLNYNSQKKNIENLLTVKMTHIMDGRLVEFWEKQSATATALKKIIQGKLKFPQEEFLKLKDAFPCILAGIRDYAEYIPLEPEIFDLVIIDEASQVSIAQAFPALLRAKKVLILGDKKQFSNVKTAQARTDTNREYLNNLKDCFIKCVASDGIKLEKLKNFNIKTSVLEFFEYISNYNIQLLKHFRGYKEVISYSNKYFYQNSLQVMKIRGKAIDDVIKFSFIKYDGKKELAQNTNTLEVEFIISELKKLKEIDSNQSVGIITPHTNQQKLLVELISKLPEKDYFYDKLKLKIMTFDTCQGEERDIIFYSMVATEEDDHLWGVFIKDLSNVENEEDGKIKAQRLNVGLSRAKETMNFILSKPIDKYNGSIGEALRHYYFILNEAKKERSVSEVDEKSKMEPEVMNWFYQTDFWKKNKDNIEFIPQFELGKYLKQLDKTYNHPKYKVDFLLVYKDETHQEHKIIIEYDGFREHFKNIDEVNEFNYQEFFTDADVYRQKVLESYGYKFLRINKFNIGNDPISILNERIGSLIKNGVVKNNVIIHIHETIEGLQNGDMKECPKCKKIREYREFRDPDLITGYGRFCCYCKGYTLVEKPISDSDKGESVFSSEKICPNCGSKMILRSGRYGQFYGCSKFPYCRGTKPI